MRQYPTSPIESPVTSFGYGYPFKQSPIWHSTFACRAVAQRRRVLRHSAAPCANRQSGSDSHLVPDRPEIVEDRFEERFFEKRNTGRTAGAFFRANGAFDQFDVTITPFLQSFVEVGHQLEENRNFG